MVILNLSSSQQTIDVSTLASSASTFHQISGFPGDYITGGSNGFYINSAGKAVADALVITDSTPSVPATLSSPAYFITRIMVRLTYRLRVQHREIAGTT
jgi:hypothetical protein